MNPIVGAIFNSLAKAVMVLPHDVFCFVFILIRRLEIRILIRRLKRRLVSVLYKVRLDKSYKK